LEGDMMMCDMNTHLEIEEKELEEARAFLVETEKRKGKKGKKVTGDGVSSFCS